MYKENNYNLNISKVKLKIFKNLKGEKFCFFEKIFIMQII